MPVSVGQAVLAPDAVSERGADQFGLGGPAPVHRGLAGVRLRDDLIDGELVVPGLDAAPGERLSAVRPPAG